MSIIKKFIEDNGLDFSGSGSELNSNICILCGFALYKGFTDYGSVLEQIDEELGLSGSDINQFESVFNHAKIKRYDVNWHSGKYKGVYKY